MYEYIRTNLSIDNVRIYQDESIYDPTSADSCAPVSWTLARVASGVVESTRNTTSCATASTIGRTRLAGRYRQPQRRQQWTNPRHAPMQRHMPPPHLGLAYLYRLIARRWLVLVLSLAKPQVGSEHSAEHDENARPCVATSTQRPCRQMPPSKAKSKTPAVIHRLANGMPVR